MLAYYVLPKKLQKSGHFPHWRHHLLPFLTFLILFGKVGRIFFLSLRFICFFLLMHFSNVAFNFHILWEKFLADVALKLDCFTNLHFFAVCLFWVRNCLGQGFIHLLHLDHYYISFNPCTSRDEHNLMSF